ncbi:MAG: FtsX-like permease family protein [Nitrospinota bacterium]|nr:FtsX-like permease family protein [Nitrospinota bacterium]
MIRWLLKGIWRDKTRSLFPFLVISVGVTLLIYLLGFMEGIFAGMLDVSAHLDTGHLRFVNKPFYDEEHLIPLDRALGGQNETLEWLRKNSDPRIEWSPRIRWGAIMDVPDEKGETRSQTPVVGVAIEMLAADSPERIRLDLERSVIAGRVPSGPKEMLVGYKLAEALGLQLDDFVTLLGQNFDGGMATDNYKVVGFVRFGLAAMDKKMALIDLTDAQQTFYMEDMVTDFLGFLPREVGYKEYDVLKINIESHLALFKQNPPKNWAADDDPIILSILDQRNLRELAVKFELVDEVVVGVFALLMILVLWNAGLLNGVHRYGEMGLLLAMGETHKKLIGLMALEAFMIGLIGSAAGCLIGGGLVYYLQEVGVSTHGIFETSGLMMSDTIHARLSTYAFVFAVIPGVTASVVGNLIANLAIYQRSEANLFRELEAG